MISDYCPLKCQIFQEIPGELYASGDRWIHQCLECECLNGEVDCWPLTCPSTCPRSSSTHQPSSSTLQPSCCSQNHLSGCDPRSAVNSTDLCWGCKRQVGKYQVQNIENFYMWFVKTESDFKLK